MRRFFIGALTVFGLMALSGVAPAAAQDDATPVPQPASSGAALTIAKMNCPPAMPGDDIDPNECTTPAQGVQFFIANPNTDNVEFGTTKGDGLISFPLDKYILSPDGSEVSLGEVLANNPYGEVTGYLVSCTRNGSPLDFEYAQPEVQPGGATYGIRFTANPGDQIACEWYDALASSGGQQTGNKNETGGTVTKLPTTGSGGAVSSSDDATPLWLIGAAFLALLGALDIRRALRR